MRKTLATTLAAALLAVAAAAHGGPVSPQGPTPSPGFGMELQPAERIEPVDGGGVRLFLDSTRYRRPSDRVDLGPWGSFTLSDKVATRSLQATALFVTTAAGLTDAGRTSLSLGAADFRDADGFSGGYAPFAELSSGGLLHRDERRGIDYGVSLLAGASTGYEETADSAYPLKAKVRMPWHAAVAVGAQGQYRPGVTLYGGALVRYGMAQVLLYNPTTVVSKHYLHERGLLGLYGGVSARLGDRFRAEAELQVRGLLDPSGIQDGISGGVTLVWFPGAPRGGEEVK